MKKWICLLLSVGFLAVSAFACGKEENKDQILEESEAIATINPEDCMHE